MSDNGALSTSTGTDADAHEVTTTTATTASLPTQQLQQQQQHSPLLHEHSNSHLLKMDTGDKYSTVTVLKRIIAKAAAATQHNNNNNSEGDNNNNNKVHDESTRGTTRALLPGMLRINKNPSTPYVYMAFATSAHRTAALQLLQTLQFRGRPWREVSVTASDLRVTHKGGKRAREQQQQQQQQSGDTTSTSSSSTATAAASKVAAYACLPMEEQLRRKRQHCLDTLTRLLAKEEEVTGGDDGAAVLAAQRFEGVTPSPQLYGYRNHVHLTFGYDAHGTPALGFNAGAMVEGKVTIESIVDDDDDGDDDEPAETNDKSDTKADNDDNDHKDSGSSGNNKGCAMGAAVTVHVLARLVAAAVLRVCRRFLPPPSTTKAATTTAATDATATTRTRNDGDNSNNDSNNDSNSEKSDEATALTVFDRVSGSGFWRRLQIRHNVRGDVMLDLEVNTTGVCDAQLAAVLRCLVDATTSPTLTRRLRRCSGLATAAVASVQYHVHSGIGTTAASGDAAARVLLYGSGSTLVEELCGLRFEVSPTSFFQVNTPATECLLTRVAASAQLQPSRTTLLDLCSGTGTIGLCLARSVRRVIGIELVEAAVQNARANAARNNITNAVFHCGRVEHVLPSVLRSLAAADRDDVVAVLDPPRAGVTSTVLQWLRGMTAIRRVVYISCEQRALERDCPHLCKPSTKAYRGAPFAVTSAFAVDLFPHTPHVEMVVVLTRRHTHDDAHGVSTEQQATVTVAHEEAYDADKHVPGTGNDDK